MKTDRELLELAAKAAGVNLQWMGGPVELRDGIITAWNPLTNDGDALRLAVKLEIHIRFHGATVLCECPSGTWLADEVDTTGDRRAATRRAIVRAAAEFGGAV